MHWLHLEPTLTYYTTGCTWNPLTCLLKADPAAFTKSKLAILKRMVATWRFGSNGYMMIWGVVVRIQVRKCQTAVSRKCATAVSNCIDLGQLLHLELGAY
jgi:hypothetical protein